MNSNNNIVVFLDPIQRTIIATLVNETDVSLTITKPVILNVSLTQDKKLQVQLYPLFFREFTANRDEFANWTYSKSSISISNVKLEQNLIAQYTQMFEVAVTSNAPVVKLFDDETK